MIIAFLHEMIKTKVVEYFVQISNINMISLLFQGKIFVSYDNSGGWTKCCGTRSNKLSAFIDSMTEVV